MLQVLAQAWKIGTTSPGCWVSTSACSKSPPLIEIDALSAASVCVTAARSSNERRRSCTPSVGNTAVPASPPPAAVCGGKSKSESELNRRRRAQSASSDGRSGKPADKPATLSRSTASPGASRSGAASPASRGCRLQAPARRYGARAGAAPDSRSPEEESGGEWRWEAAEAQAAEGLENVES